MWSDASDKHYAGVVTQTDEAELAKPVAEQVHHPLAFISGSFRDSSLNWTTTEKEGYALLTTCERTEHLVCRTAGFHVFTDHNNLTYLFDPRAEGPCASKPASDHVQRWRVTIERFSYHFHHIPGEKHVVADMFSRWANPDFTRAPSADTVVEGAARSARSRRKKTKTVDAELLRFEPDDFPSVEDIRQAQVKHLTRHDKMSFALTLGTTTRVWSDPAGRIFVPDANSLRQRLCVLAHQGEAGHRGIDNTLRLLRERFVWMGLDADVGTFVRQCLHCLKVRGGRTVPRPWGDTLHANGPHQVLHFDFMRRTLPLSMGTSTCS